MKKIRQLLSIDRIHRSEILGQGIGIAILDTGIYSHRDFKGRIVEFKDCTTANRTAMYDDNSHGTHVAGIAAGSGAASKGSYTGMAPAATIIPIKVLNRKGHGDSSIIMKGIQWLCANHIKYNIRVVNISIGTPSSTCADESSGLVRAVDSMWDMGITVIVSAGNNGPGYHTITTPGISRKIITVGSSNHISSPDAYNGTIRTYSGKGPTFCEIPKPDIVAPGADIISCHNQRNGYTAKSGTSMSTPIVSGAAALVFSYNKTLTNNEFKQLLCQSADNLGYDRYTQGCGLINITRLLSLC